VASFGFRYDYTLRRLQEADQLAETAQKNREKLESSSALPLSISRGPIATNTEAASTSSPRLGIQKFRADGRHAGWTRIQETNDKKPC